MKKYFELEEDRLKDYLKKEERWVKEKKETEELKKRTVSRVRVRVLALHSENHM